MVQFAVMRMHAAFVAHASCMQQHMCMLYSDARGHKAVVCRSVCTGCTGRLAHAHTAMHPDAHKLACEVQQCVRLQCLCTRTHACLRPVHRLSTALRHDKLKEEQDSRTGRVLFRGPRLKMGVAEGPPRAILPDHLGLADYFGNHVNNVSRAKCLGWENFVNKDIDIMKGAETA